MHYQLRDPLDHFPVGIAVYTSQSIHVNAYALLGYVCVCVCVCACNSSIMRFADYFICTYIYGQLLFLTSYRSKARQSSK